MLPSFNLIVLSVADIERSADFYRLLGLQFKKHTHGKGPQHYACELGGVVFELYPASPQQPASSSARIGFAVPNVDEVVKRLSAEAAARVIALPEDSEWGRRAVICDPDGHRIELVSPIGGH